MGFHKYILYFIVFNCPVFIFAQTDKIKIKKEDNFYFFQLGQKSDTIISGKNDLFYLKMTGKTGCNTHIEIENGRFMKTKNDTIFQLKNIPNLQYLHYFQDSTFVAHKSKPGEVNDNCHKFITHINGANEARATIVKVVFFNVNSKDVLLSNTFFFK
jgi:hypothetical protein